MADRRRQTIQLLGSRHDGLYLPPGALSTRAGFVPSERTPCTDCGGILIRDDFGTVIHRRKGRGTIVDRYRRRQPCTRCGGGTVAGELVSGTGYLERDPMDVLGVRVGSEATTSTARPRHRKTCDRCGGDGVWKSARCELCDGHGTRDVHLFELHLEGERSGADPLAAAIDARIESGSYAELERALDRLDRFARTLLLADVDSGRRPLGSAVEVSLAFVVARMPDPIRVPAEVVANDRERRSWAKRAKGRGTSAQALKARDAEIRQAVRRLPAQRVAFEYGLSVSQVNRIVNGEEAA